MRKKLKIGLSIISIVIVSTIVILGYGFYSMEIEDHYGDFQDLYYKAKTNDIIINKTTSDFGIIEKNWKRINVKTPEKDSTDLYNFIVRNGITTKVEIYSPPSKTIEISEIKYSDLLEMIKKSNLRLNIRN